MMPLTKHAYGGGDLALAVLLLTGSASGQWDYGQLPEVPPIDGFAMAWDEGRSRVVLFGGVAEGNPIVYFGETWEWDGVRWTLRRTTISPPARAHAAMAWDPSTQSVLLFGGKGHAGVLNDTWLYDGRDWVQVPGPVAPSPRVAHRMAPDSVRSRVVLFGGFPDTLFTFQTGNPETWEWDGRRWMQRFPVSLQPAGRGGQGMAFHSNTGRVAMFGGGSGLGRLPTVPLLEWDGTDWIQVPATGGVDPGPLLMVGGATDPVSGGLILHGGAGFQGATDRTYRWHNGGWSLLDAGNTVAGARMSTVSSVVDFVRRELVGYGRTVNHVTLQDDSTWVLDLGQATWRRAHEYVRPYTRHAVFDSRRDGFWVAVWSNNEIAQMWWLDDNGFRLVPSQPPYPRAGYISYHESSGLVMTHDGLGRTTWTWDGASWAAHQYAIQPVWPGPGSYDPQGQRTLHLSATERTLWAWQPSGWSMVAGQDSRLPRTAADAFAAFDAARARFVFVGADPSPPYSTVLWEWDGTNWMRSPVPVPAGIEGRWLRYMPDFGGIVLVGLRPGEWLWDGTSWTAINFPTSIPWSLAYFDAGSAYDTNRRRLRFFVWLHGAQPQIWDLARRSLSVSRPDPNPGDVITFAMDAASEAGKPWLLGLSTARYPGLPLGPAPYHGTETLPLAPDWLLSLSLSSWLGGVLDNQGRGQTAVWVPGSPSLLGFRCHAAAVTVGPGWSIDHVSTDLAITIVP